MKEDKVILLPVGMLFIKSLEDTVKRFGCIEIHHSVVMPNHVHMLLQVHDNKVTLSQVISYLKSLSTRLVISEVKQGRLDRFNQRIWQPSFYEHVLRNEKEFAEYVRYIDENPYRWREDEYWG